MYGTIDARSGRVGTHPGPFDFGLSMVRDRPIADLADLVGPAYVCDGDIRHLAGSTERIIGVAVSAKCVPGDNFAVFGALKHLFAGSILAIDNRSLTQVCTGGGQVAFEAAARGARAIVTNGMWRDASDLPCGSGDIAVYGRGLSNVSPPKVRPGEVNVPIVCGGVIVMPGDLLVLDIEGCLAVPRALALALESVAGPPRKSDAEVRKGIQQLAATWAAQSTSNFCS